MTSENKMTKIGEGQEADIFLSAENKVIKLFKRPGFEDKCCEEEEFLRILYETGIPVPKTYGTILLDGKPGYTMDYIKGESLLSILLKNTSKIHEQAQKFARLHADINSHTAPVSFKNEKDSLVWCIEHSGLDSAVKEYGLSLLHSLPVSDSLCHGDYNLTNVIITETGKPVFIDCGNAAKGYFVSDIANAYLMIVNGDKPKGAGFFIITFLFFFRQIFAQKYISSYKKIRNFTRREFNDWLLIRSMAKLAFCNDAEKPWLNKYIKKHI